MVKSRKIMSERVGNVVARGDAEIGFQQLSELIPIEGIDIVGPLPAELPGCPPTGRDPGAERRHARRKKRSWR